MILLWFHLQLEVHIKLSNEKKFAEYFGTECKFDTLFLNPKHIIGI